jgi:uncharacterized membrane protein
VSPRTVVTAVVIVFIGGFAFLTAVTMIKHGVDVLSLISLVVLLLFAIGIVGALSSQGPDE